MVLSIVVFIINSLGSRLHGHRNQALVLTFVLACLPLAKATTEWALSDSISVIAGPYRSSITPDAQIVTEQAFKSLYNSIPVSPFTTSFKMDLGSSKKMTMANIVNFYQNENNS